MSFYLSVAQKGINSPWESFIQSASSRYGVPVSLIKGIISAESGWNPNISSSSSHGLMQLNSTYFHNPDGSPIFDPETNINIGTSLIGEQLSRRPSVELALAGYNAGTSRSDSDLAARIAANTNGVGSYISNVLAYRDWFIQQEEGGGDGDGRITPTPPWGEDEADLKLIAGIVVCGLLAFALLRR
jgi:soluble lytic murein transglycosylase-like protein